MLVAVGYFGVDGVNGEKKQKADEETRDQNTNVNWGQC
jgi:hypothetical protein